MQLSYQTVALALMTMGLSAADFSSSCLQVKNSADSIKSKVDAWSAKDGLVSALDIQSAFGGLNSAVSSLSTDSHKISNGDLQVSAITTLSSSINGLLGSLTKKQSDFQQVSAKDIVSNDISTMSKPTLDIVNSLIKVVQNDCSKANALQPSLKSLGTSFNTVNSAYGLAEMNFPSEVPCKAKKETQNSDSSSSSSPSVSASQNSDALSTVYSTTYIGSTPTSNASETTDMGSMGSMSMPMPTDSASSSSVSPDTPPPMPFVFPNRNSTASGLQPSVSMSNGAESLSSRAILAAAVVGPAVALFL